MKTVNSLLRYFGVQLVSIDDQPREVVRAFAYEIEQELQYYYDDSDPFSEITRFRLSTSLREGASNIEEALYNSTPSHVRYHAVDIAVHAMVAADVFGELLPRASGNHRKAGS